MSVERVRYLSFLTKTKISFFFSVLKVGDLFHERRFLYFFLGNSLKWLFGYLGVLSVDNMHFGLLNAYSGFRKRQLQGVP